MTSVSLAQAKAQLSDLVRRGQAGEAIEITVRGKPMVRLVAIDPPRQPIDFEALARITADIPYQEQSAGEFMRWVRDADRY